MGGGNSNGLYLVIKVKVITKVTVDIIESFLIRYCLRIRKSDDDRPMQRGNVGHSETERTDRKNRRPE